MTHEHALSGLSIVESSLDDVVGERVSKELLKSVSVEEFGDEDLPGIGLGDSDALEEVEEMEKDQRGEEDGRRKTRL